MSRAVAILEATHSAGCRSCSSCRPTCRARRCRRCGAALSISSSPPSCERGSTRSHARRTRRCSWSCTPRLTVLLSRLAGVDDIAIGTPVAGRGERELDDLIGMFVNTLVLRSRVSSRAAVRRIARRDTRDGPGGVRACGCAVRAGRGGAESATVAPRIFRCTR